MQIKDYSLSNAYLTLVGNKCDMEKERAVTYEKESNLLSELDLNSSRIEPRTMSAYFGCLSFQLNLL